MTRSDASYRNAVVALAGSDEKFARQIDKALGGIILASATLAGPGALALIGIKNEVMKWGQDYLARLPARLKKLGSGDRIDNIASAQAILAVTTLVETAQEQFRWQSVGVTSKELQWLATPDNTALKIASGLAARLLETKLPVPDPYTPIDEITGAVEDFAADYWRKLSDIVGAFADAGQFNTLVDTFDDSIAAQLSFKDSVKSRFLSHIVRLAGEVQEYSFWCIYREVRGMHKEFAALKSEAASSRVGLARVDYELRRLSHDFASPARHGRAESLVNYYRANVQHGVLDEADEEREGLQSPAVEVLYQEPRYKLAESGSMDGIATEGWWSRFPTLTNFDEFILSYLTSRRALTSPLLILGHPGAGKSMLTRMLCARFPGERYLPIRVPLRSVRSNVDVFRQIEDALHTTLRGPIAYAELVDSNPHLLPVVFLDGFDELLQASGVSQSDYLDKVARFQRDERDRGRPVSVIVTTRISVADRARPPAGSLAIKLEPLSRDQVKSWILLWNNANATGFNDRNLRPLSFELAIRFKALAEQPVLLLMLAIYDSYANGLAHLSPNDGSAVLYGQILHQFARREVVKDSAGLESEQLQQVIEQELVLLSTAAVGMFNRGRQSINSNELDHDLDALWPREHPTEQAGFSMPLGRGDRMLGRFFFVHTAESRESVESHAELDPPRAADSTSFEFLHATFGEFLVARMAIQLLQECKLSRRSRLLGLGQEDIFDDDMLRALFSFQVLPKRTQILSFASELYEKLDATERHLVKETIVKLLQKSPDAVRNTMLLDYKPLSLTSIERFATYSANLAALFFALEKSSAIEVIAPAGSEPADWWRRFASLWRSQLDPEGWRSMVQFLRGEPHEPELELHSQMGQEGEEARSALYSSFEGVVGASTQYPPEHIAILLGGGEIDLGLDEAVMSLDGNALATWEIVEVLSQGLGGRVAETQVLALRDQQRNPWIKMSDFRWRTSGAAILSAIAFPADESPARTERLHNLVNQLLDVMGTERTRIQYMRQLFVHLDSVPSSVLRQSLDLSLRYGPSNANSEYYTLLCELSCRAHFHFPEGGFLAVARTALARLDLPHFLTAGRDELLRFATRIEMSGTSLGELDEEGLVGGFEDWLDRVDLVTISETSPELISRAFNILRIRQMHSWIGERFTLIERLSQESWIEMRDSGILEYVLACLVASAKFRDGEFRNLAAVSPFLQWVREQPDFADGIGRALAHSAYGRSEQRLFDRALERLHYQVPNR